MAEWTKAVFQGTASHLGPQPGETYHIDVRTPGQFYPYCVLVQELPGSTDEYLTLASVQKDWQLVESPSAPVSPAPPAPMAPGLSEDEAEDFYLNVAPFDGTFSASGEDEDDF